MWSVCIKIILLDICVTNIKCSIFFPLAAVNVSLPWPVDPPHPLPQLLDLVVMRDVPEILVPVTSSEQTFSLVEEPPDGWFYIEGHSLKVKSAFFDSEAKRTADNFKLTVFARMGEDGPTNMTINIELTDPALICKDPKQLCFWDGAEYQIAENLESPTIGELSSKMIQSFCPQYSMGYRIEDSKCNPDNQKCEKPDIVVNRQMNGRGPWLLAVRDQLDREDKVIQDIVVLCKIDETNSSQILKRTLHIKVRDIDDNPPTASFHLHKSIENSNIITAGDVVAMGYYTDKDHPLTNHFETSLTNDWLTFKCNSPEELIAPIPKTNAHCTIMATKTFNITEENVVIKLNVTDTTLVPGYGVKTTIQELILQRNEHSLPFFLASTSNELYPTGLVQVELVNNLKYRKFTRVIAPANVGDWQFTTVGATNFGVTAKQGIVYVKNGSDLKEGMKYNLTLKWWKGADVRNQTIWIEIIESTKLCNKSMSGYKWCAEEANAAECGRMCGYGTQNGECHWVKIGEGDKKYSSCSSAKNTCPDQNCDALEQLNNGICPQDCTRRLLGTGTQKKNQSGIHVAWGICNWEKERNVTHCSSSFTLNEEKDQDTHSLSKDDPNEPREADTVICGLSCQASAAGFSLSLAIGLLILILYIRRLRGRTKRCVSEPIKEDLASTTTYDESMRRPLREPEPPARPDFYDAKWEFPRHRLTIEETVGEGEFGKVIKARADGIQGHKGQKTVAVKTLKSGAKEAELDDLVSELQLLKDVDHPNIIKLLGACTTEDGPLYVIIEYAEHGSLRNYLKKHRQTEKEESCYLEGVSPLTARHILTFAWHISKGMSYLAEMKLVHRDLAARNVLLTDDLVCKISDFGLTRDIYIDDTYMKRSKGKVPIKWMALESLADHIYTSRSDVWSYGILLWELVTRGNSPYPGVPAQNLYNFLQDGYRMERPEGCSTELYGLMRACWAATPAHRPTFASIVAQLDAMLSASRNYLDLRPSAVENRHYMENEEVQWQFGGYDRPTAACCCTPGQCSHVKYENELQAFNVDLINGESSNLLNDAPDLQFDQNNSGL